MRKKYGKVDDEKWVDRRGWGREDYSRENMKFNLLLTVIGIVCVLLYKGGVHLIHWFQK